MKVREVFDSKVETFVELVYIAGLSPGMSFRYGDLRGGDFRGENLGGFDFTCADFAGANVAGTIFTGAILKGADFSKSIGLEEAIFDKAWAIEEAIFPTEKYPPSSWADDSGTDEVGPWASFSLTITGSTTVTQRLRWIPPGQDFRMGSPPDENGRFENEGLSEPISFRAGFWMFETLATQDLWTSVMVTNPSRFQGPNHPVESVSFHDTRWFIESLNALKPGLALTLPSEAQWEYACRAGTTSSTYAGPAVVNERGETAALNRIAWWSGNSDEQTHPVAQKAPNGWGLYDMLGNVWEWCADGDYGGHAGAHSDGPARGTGDDAADRVGRGASWLDDAWNVRAACRHRNAPSLRGDGLGFRCVRRHS
jgi:formylglycine-generating enzyme required for sulfatase activity